MATVRFSQELRDNILRSARFKMQPAVDRAHESAPNTPEWADRIYNILFGDDLPALNSLPDYWFHKFETFEVARTCGMDVTLSFKFATPKRWPVNFERNDLAKRAGYGSGRIELFDEPQWAEFKTEVAAYKEKLDAATKRKEEFVDSVRQVINAYTTLAPALKAWPALWELIPESVKDKHREVVERTKKDIEVSVDLNKMTAIISAAKLGV